MATCPTSRKRFSKLSESVKYEETLRDPDAYFQNVKLINFDITHHLSRGDPLEKPYNEHFLVRKKDFVKYEEKDKKQVVSGLFRNQEKTKQPVYIEEKVVLDHFKK